MAGGDGCAASQAERARRARAPVERQSTRMSRAHYATRRSGCCARGPTNDPVRRRAPARRRVRSRSSSEGEGKKIGLWGMVVVGFFWVHGGIYGNEAMLMAGPPLYVFIMLGIVPFVYSLPIALIVAELSTAFPEDGGYVVWVQEACGRTVGCHHAYWVWVIYLVDAAIYPVLVANYVDTMVPMSDTSRGLLALAIIFGVTVINLAGTDVMVKFNTALAIISLTPTLIFTLMGLPSVSVSRCLVSEGDVRAPTRPLAHSPTRPHLATRRLLPPAAAAARPTPAHARRASAWAILTATVASVRTHAASTLTRLPLSRGVHSHAASTLTRRRRTGGLDAAGLVDPVAVLRLLLARHARR